MWHYISKVSHSSDTRGLKLLELYKAKDFRLSGQVYYDGTDYLNFAKRCGSRYLDYYKDSNSAPLEDVTGDIDIILAKSESMYVSYREPWVYFNSEIIAKLKNVHDFRSIENDFPGEFSDEQHDKLTQYLQKHSLGACLQHESLLLNHRPYDYHDFSDVGWPALIHCYMMAYGWNIKPIAMENITEFLSDRYPDIPQPDALRYSSGYNHFKGGHKDNMADLDDIVMRLWPEHKLNFDNISDYVKLFDPIVDFFSYIMSEDPDQMTKTQKARLVLNKFVTQTDFLKFSVSDLALIRTLHRPLL